jgi:hypothetical protein
MRKLTATLIAAFVTVAVANPVQARHHHSGSCDGIHRCRCGSTQARHFGLPRIFKGHNLWRAIEWTRAFPHTVAHAGVVMYQHGGGPSGHVSRLVSDPVGCTAMVADDAGQYERNICTRGAQFVSVL